MRKTKVIFFLLLLLHLPLSFSRTRARPKDYRLRLWSMEILRHNTDIKSTGDGPINQLNGHRWGLSNRSCFGTWQDIGQKNRTRNGLLNLIENNRVIRQITIKTAIREWIWWKDHLSAGPRCILSKRDAGAKVQNKPREWIERWPFRGVVGGGTEEGPGAAASTRVVIPVIMSLSSHLNAEQVADERFPSERSEGV